MTPDDLPQDWRERYEERAAIRHFDGGQALEHAEAEALAETVKAMSREGKRLDKLSQNGYPKSMNLEQTLLAAARKSGESMNSISKRGNVPYMSLHSFMTGKRTLTLPLASKLAEALNLELVPKKRKAVK